MNNLLRKKTNELQKKKKKGFTLVELIIVIAIIAILAAIAIPKFGEIRENSAKRTDVATAKNIATSIATEIANESGVVTLPTSTATAVPDTILNKLDGQKAVKSSAAGNDKKFYYTIESNGNIKILYQNNTVVYPIS